MANIKSQKKRIITNEKSRMRNRAVKSELKTATRRVRDAVAEGDGAKAFAEAQAACRLMDKAVAKGVIHKNQAANRKSGIMKLVNTIATDEAMPNMVGTPLANSSFTFRPLIRFSEKENTHFFDRK